MPGIPETPEIPAIPATRMIQTIRAERATDVAAIHTVQTSAFGRADEANLVDELRKDASFIPPLSLVAEEAGEIVGHVLLTSAQILGADGSGGASESWPALALAPVAVLPAWQKRGIGSALIRHGLREATRLGHRLVVVLGHASYYPRFGFTSARDAGIVAPFPVRDESFMALALVAGALNDVAGTIQYAPPFTNV